MRIPRSIHENMRFLITEVSSQVSHLQTYFETSSVIVAKRILDRSGYTYNLKTSIHRSCLGRIARNKNARSEGALLRSVETIATDLDRISELCRDCIQQTGYLNDTGHLPTKLYVSLLERIGRGIRMIDEAINKSDTKLALKIGRIENKLDCTYRKLLKKYTRDLKQQKKKHTEDLVASLFVAHSIEQMGDVLLSISEAIISANLGQQFNTDRYHSLQASVEKLSGSNNGSDLALETVAQTRSGSGISGISTTDKKGNEYQAIFKDGLKRKVKEERQGVESWHEIYPGLAPKILSYHKHGQSASLLIEHLAGLTFEQILLHEPHKLLKQTMHELQKTLKSVWKETRTKKPVSANYMGQLQSRLDDVYALHPEFKQDESQICGTKVPSFDTLLKRARSYEAGLKAPFSVYIHGDFNVDNIIYDPLERKINFIDLHRSNYMDYVQDISVFMVSNYRLRVVDPKIRRRIRDLSCNFYNFSRAYADKIDDQTFDLRLALGLARSFATSTRFMVDKTLSRAMWLRARYLIEKVLMTDPKKARDFRVPVREIFVG
ncbi:MAG: PhoU domain-containing protein [Gammaproteobacteria bacterium]|nr:PhoU domain-containing protein [Gammaproteobacteria bacterium]MDX2487513.1 PhoU domain-containing protein [Gammaproteobacteria bacterium]